MSVETLSKEMSLERNEMNRNSKIVVEVINKMSATLLKTTSDKTTEALIYEWRRYIVDQCEEAHKNHIKMQENLTTAIEILADKLIAKYDETLADENKRWNKLGQYMFEKKNIDSSMKIGIFLYFKAFKKPKINCFLSSSGIFLEFSL